jgi:polysaccharide biosynthesis transport protein
LREFISVFGLNSLSWFNLVVQQPATLLVERKMNAERDAFDRVPLQNSSMLLESLQPKRDTVDVLKTAWRWKWLILLGLLVGLVVGYLVVIQLPPLFKSESMVQILTPKQSGENSKQLDLGESALMETRQDEIRIMRSTKVIDNAIRAGKLDQDPFFAGKSMDEMYVWLIDEDRLTILPGTKELKTDLVYLGFECENKELSGQVLQSILAGYQQYLSDTYSDRGSEVFEKLAKYQEEYEDKFRKARDQYTKQVSSINDAIWNEDGVQNPHAKLLEEIMIKAGQLNAEADSIDSVISQAEEALAANRNPDGILAMLEKELGRLDPSRANAQLETMQKWQAMRATSDMNVSKIENDILNANIRRDTASNSFGPKHKSVQAIDDEIERLNKKLEELNAASEKSRQELQDELNIASGGARTMEERLSAAMGALVETRQALNVEMRKLAEREAVSKKQSTELQTQLAQVEVLQREMESFEETSEELAKYFQSLQIGSDYNRKKMQILDEPNLGYPSGPSRLKFLGIGGLIGMSLFFGLAYLFELADRSYRSPDEILKSLNVPVLGHIPIFEADRRDLRDQNIDASVVTLHKPQSNTSECYRGIRTSLFFANKKHSTRVIQVTSPLPGDGKSTLASNMAVSLAQSGRSVLMVDCDLRRPRAAKIFGVADDFGITSCLLGTSTLQEAIKPTSIEGLSVLASGPRVANPSELLVSPEFENLLIQLRNDFEFVVIDTPPVLSVSDPASVAPLVDAVILTMRLRRNSKPIAEQAKNILDSVDARIVGITINGVDQKSNYGYGGYRYDNSGLAGYSYANKSYGYGGSGKVYGDEAMQNIAKTGTQRPARRTRNEG